MTPFFAHGEEFSDSFAWNTQYRIQEGFDIDVTYAAIDEKELQRWETYFSKQLEDDLNSNPKLLTHIEGLEWPGRNTAQSSHENTKSKVKSFLEKITQSKLAYKVGQLSEKVISQKTRSKFKDLYKDNKPRIFAASIRFLFNGGATATMFLASDDPIATWAAVTAGVLTGGLSATASWYANTINTWASKTLESNRLFRKHLENYNKGKFKSAAYKVSTEIEYSFKWGLVDLAFVGLIKLGLLMMGVESTEVFNTLSGAAIWTGGILSSVVKAVLSQGEYEKAVNTLGAKMKTNDADPKKIQATQQYLYLVGSVLSTFGTLADAFHVSFGGYQQIGNASLFTLFAGGVMLRIAVVKSEQLKSLGLRIKGGCWRLLEKFPGNKNISDTDQSSIWVISPVQCSV